MASLMMLKGWVFPLFSCSVAKVISDLSCCCNSSYEGWIHPFFFYTGWLSLIYWQSSTDCILDKVHRCFFPKLLEPRSIAFELTFPGAVEVYVFLYGLRKDQIRSV